MKKVAIVGVEGSGKTVMLAGLAALYERPDENGYYLDPKDPETFWYTSDQIALMRQGKWPAATEADSKRRLTWTLCKRSGGRPQRLSELSFLDFAGEVYRAAFGVGERAELSEEAKELRQYVDEAEVLFVLVNLSDVIAGRRTDPRVRESMWLTKAILDWATDEDKKTHPRTAIVLSQCDLYRSTIDSCGGAKAVLEKYLPIVGNNYSWLDVFSVSSVDKTRLGADGTPVPEEDFKSTDLRALMSYILGEPVVLVDLPQSGDAQTSTVRLMVDPEPGDEMTLALPGGGEMTFCWCPATTSEAWKKISGGEDFFWMGSPDSELGREGDEIRHRVTLTEGFWMGKYAVTQRQWECVTGGNPSSFKDADHPVETVSWDDCQEFIQKINAAGRMKVTLPTEAQWEYACRAGTTTPFNFGSTLNGDKANCDANYPYGMKVGGQNRLCTMPVGSYSPNAWGLCDMHGNVDEWCQDWYGVYGGDGIDPTGPMFGKCRVNRGGCWSYGARLCRAANRGRYVPGMHDETLGLRLVCSEGPRR